jgi:hypothetical protein
MLYLNDFDKTYFYTSTKNTMSKLPGRGVNQFTIKHCIFSNKQQVLNDTK